MRATLGYILALALAATPALARANGPADNGSAAGSDSSTAAKSDTATKTDAATMESELEELRGLLESQASQLQDQNDQLKATQAKIQSLEKELKASAAAPAVSSSAAASTLAVSSTPASSVSSSGMPVAESSSSSSVPAADPQAVPAARGVTTASLKETYSLPPTYGTNPALPEPQGGSPLSFRIGSADFTPGGFMDLTDVFRTKSEGGSIGTSFSGIPYKIAANYPLAGTTENHFSAQNSRVSLRMDSTVAGGKVVGYLETDFLGNAAAGLATTSNANTLRMRLYFVDYTRGHFEFLAGQDWSMLVSNRNGIGFMPGDVFYSQDMDTNYQMGLAWERTPQFRFIYHPNTDWAFGFSMENEDQYIGTGVTVPSGANSGSQPVNGQFDPTTATPNTPALLPTIVVKGAFDHMISGRHIHIEALGVARTFRIENYTAPSTSSPFVTNGPANKVEGGAVAVNSNWEIFKNFRIFENAFWGDGDGRLIANSNVPDIVIRPVTPGSATGPYTLSAVHAGSFIGGFEWQATPKFMLYGYDGGVYVSKNTGFVGATPFGWGFIPLTSGTVAAQAGTAEAQNRFMQEPTIGVIITMWRNPQYGALQLITQASYAQRSPWVVVTGTPTVATDTMAWADVRYTLP